MYTARRARVHSSAVLIYLRDFSEGFGPESGSLIPAGRGEASEVYVRAGEAALRSESLFLELYV